MLPREALRDDGTSKTQVRPTGAAAQQLCTVIELRGVGGGGSSSGGGGGPPTPWNGWRQQVQREQWRVLGGVGTGWGKQAERLEHGGGGVVVSESGGQ